MEGAASSEAMDAMRQRHRDEKKALQARITNLRKSVTKGDKKRKVAVQDEIAQLENELAARHEDELKSLTAIPATQIAAASVSDAASAAVISQITSLVLDENDHNDQTPDENEDDLMVQKKSRALRRREKKAAEVENRARIAAEYNATAGPSAREQECLALMAGIAGLNLHVHEVGADGNCLYNAIADQLELSGSESKGLRWDAQTLRRIAAEHLRGHRVDYLPFMDDADDGRAMNDVDYDQYCDRLETTATWGGQVEIRAIATELHRTIEVYQASGPVVKMGVAVVTGAEPPLRLSYHRYWFGLGEHYNSLRPGDSIAPP